MTHSGQSFKHSSVNVVPFLSMQEVVAHWIAECRLMIEQTRLLTLHAAHALDKLGSRAARKQVQLSVLGIVIHSYF